MGADHTTHVGPHVVAKCHKTERKNTTRTCTQAGCDQHGIWLSSSFCPACGRPSRMVEVKEEGASVVVHEMTRFIHEHMVCQSNESETTHYWLSNLTKLSEMFGRPTDVDQEEGSWAFSQDDIDRELGQFKELHAKHIAALEEAYDEVVIVWGVCAFWC